MSAVVAKRPGAGGRIRQALPPFWTALIGAELWAIAMMASAVFGIWLLAWKTPASIEGVAQLFAGGALLAFPLALFVARLFSGSRGPEVRFAAFFVSLTAATVGLTALIFAFDYRGYYAQWHDDQLSVRLFFEVTFTMLNAVYQFAVLGVRLLFPIGFVALILASLWFARSPH